MSEDTSSENCPNSNSCEDERGSTSADNNSTMIHELNNRNGDLHVDDHDASNRSAVVAADHDVPLPTPEQAGPSIHLTERSAQIVHAAEVAVVSSSDSVLSRTSSSSEDDENISNKHPRASSFYYMQEASVEVTVDDVDGDASLDDFEGNMDEKNPQQKHDDHGEDSSWNEVRFHESLVGQFQTLDSSGGSGAGASTEQRQQRRKSRSGSLRLQSGTRPGDPSRRRGGRRNSLLSPMEGHGSATHQSTTITSRQVLQQHKVFPENTFIVGDQCNPEQEDSLWLYLLLAPLAKQVRYNDSDLPKLIVALHPGCSPLDWSSFSKQTSTQDIAGAGVGPIVRLLMAGFPSQPALLQCPVQFAAAVSNGISVLLTHSPESKSSSSFHETDDASTPTIPPIRLDQHVMYASARFQSHSCWRDILSPPEACDGDRHRRAVKIVYELWRQTVITQNSLARHPHRPPNGLGEPLLQLLVVFCVAGITPNVLRGLIHHASAPSSLLDAPIRWSIIRAMTFMADGAAGRCTGPISLEIIENHHHPDQNLTRNATKTSSDTLHQPPMERDRTRSGSEDLVILGSTTSTGTPLGAASTQGQFFIWTGRPEGWKRKITGLASWPFRNDFGMSVWFRADHLDPARYPVLLSYRSDDSSKGPRTGGGGGGGIDVALVPLGRGIGTEACTIQVSVYDCDKHVPVQALHVPGCVLLANVWYHLAVRHSNARLKGVFSLSTRQQISILLNGKVILQQPLAFPKISATDGAPDKKTESTLLPAMMVRAAAAAAAARRPSVTGGVGMYSCTLTVGADFDGQTSAIQVFSDSVSDATFRALFQITGGHHYSHHGSMGAGSASSLIFSSKDRWDSRKSEIVKKSRILDVNITQEDADDIVLSQRRVVTLSRQKRNAAVVDVVSGIGGEDSLPINSHHSQLDEDAGANTGGDSLKPASFGSKVFLVWDPRRVVDDVAVEVHLGAHLTLTGEAYSWCMSSPQDCIQSVGGIQALIPLFRLLLEGSAISAHGLPYLFLLLKSFLHDHDDNARELLRCGGVDVVEGFIFKAGTHFLQPYHRNVDSASFLVRSLLELRAACTHYVGLEIKVFSRLLFNIPLWLTDSSDDCLHDVLLPMLSSFTKSNADKVRDCIGIRDMVYMVLNLCVDSHPANHVESVQTSNLRQTSDMLLGMIFEVLASGVTQQDLAPFLCGLAYCLEDNQTPSTAVKFSTWHVCLTTKMSVIALFLLQIRPPIQGLFENFSECCGSLQSGLAWVLCAMVKSSSDQIRAIGIRCAVEYLDVTSIGVDSPISLGHYVFQAADPIDPSSQTDVQSSVVRLGRIAKELAGVGAPGNRTTTVSTNKQTPRVAIKLLWHLLKSNRVYLGEHTHKALKYWISDDGGVVSKSISTIDNVLNHIIAESCTSQPGYRFCMEWAERILTETGSIVGRSLQRPLAVGSVIRLLRYLNGDIQDVWLSDLLLLTKSNRKSTALLAWLPDWQPCLFHLVSETLELLHNVASRAASPKKDRNNEQSSTDHHAIAQTDREDYLASVGKRLDLAIELYSTLLGHLVREGGDRSLDAVEKAVSLQRVCVNGHDVIFLVLSGLCANLFDNGTIFDMGSISAQDWKEVDFANDSLALKQSSRLVTDAILSNGTKGLDMPSAVKCWRSLRHLSAVIVALSVSSGFGIVDLFDYNYHQATSYDVISGGLHGIRLPDGKGHSVMSSTYLSFVQASNPKTEMNGSKISDSSRDVDRRFCAQLSSQILTILDAFIFPEALDKELPTSHLHALALVRNSEPRLGPSQGPLVFTAMRLSLVLVALLEPGSVTLLQCASRMRCLVQWALELAKERVSREIKATAAGGRFDGIDCMLVATLVHCHRALGRCSALMSEIESQSFDKYFSDRELHKKHHRRVLRTAMELRDVALTIFRGRTDVLSLSLSPEAFQALRASLESSRQHDLSKEFLIKEFLSSAWVSGFQDVEIRMDLAVPDQLSMGRIPLRSDQSFDSGGFTTIQFLAQESESIKRDFEKVLDGWFEGYLEETRKWAETDAVRDFEFDGDSTTKRLSEKHKLDSSEVSRNMLLRRNAADVRWRRIQRRAIEPLETPTFWKLAKYPDRNGRRTLLIQNRRFDDHKEASYELLMEKEREKAERERQARLQDSDLADVMRRNVDAFTPQDHVVVAEGRDDDSSVLLTSDGESSDVGSSSGPLSAELKDVIAPVVEESEHDEEWDTIETDEYQNTNGAEDIDAWAKSFLWSDGETVVGRFDLVTIVSLRSFAEGKLVLTTHALYFQQIGDETSAITKDPVNSDESVNTDTKHRRWRLARLTEIHGRRYLLRHQALEIFFSDGAELFLEFSGGPKERDRFYAKLRNSCKVPMLGSIKSLNPRTVFRKTRTTELWQQRKMSNFDYLIALNRMAGRSFNDITQYPVFPWILADYESESIDLTDSCIYRDLSKPIGALNPDRLAQLLERYKDLELFGFPEAERFLYGSHYSSPGIILHYLIRQEPFTTMAIELQSGRFDCPDRLFLDIAASWNGCLASSSDMKELIPEFFSLPEMFLNTNGFPLGHTQSGKAVDNVILPPWAKGSAHEFVRVHRLALESEYVSQNLHHWIDLIFGYKQRGPEAEAAHNIFHHLSYEGAVDLDKIVDEVDRHAAESHIQNFGQTPSQLLVNDPHPCRFTAADCWKPLIYSLSVPRNLRCYTPSKQFGNKGSELANGSVLKIQVFSESILVIYADMSVGTYRWFPTNKTNRLRMDRLRALPRRELSTSRSAIKRGSTIQPDKFANGNREVGNWTFAATIGGLATEQLHRKALMPASTRLMNNNEITLTNAEASSFLVSCGYWDDTLKVHSVETLQLLASETGGHQGPIRCFIVDGGLMATGGDDATCRIWVLGYPDMATSLSDGYIQTALGASNDGDQVISCCHVLWGHDTAILSLAMDSGLDVVVSGSQRGLICVHSIRRGEFIRSLRVPAITEPDQEYTGPVRKIALASTGNLVIHTQDMGLHTFTVNGVHLSSTNAGEHLLDMIICSFGEIVVTGGMKCQVYVRSVHDLRILSMMDLTRHGPVQCLAMTPDDLNPTKQFLFVGSDDGMITIIDEDPARSSATVGRNSSTSFL